MGKQLTENMRRACLSMSREDRRALAGALVQSLDREDALEAERERMQSVRDGILREWGLDVLSRDRTEPLPDLRAAFITRVRDLLPGVTQSEVARWMGIKPCSAWYHEGRMREALREPQYNPGLVQIYRKLETI